MKISNRISAQVLAALLLVFSASALWAKAEAGKILYSRGVVSIIDEQDSSRGGKTGSVVFEGDRVVTGRGALAQVRLTDGALIALRGSSDYKVEKQQFGEDEGLYEQAGKLFTGWMRSITGTIGQKYPQKVTQRTAVATIGIRGTIYQIIHIPPEGLPGFAGEEPGTYVFLESGSVELTGEGGTRLLQPGDVVFMPLAGGAPRLVPNKAQMFLDAEDGVIEFIDSEDTEFSREINETLAEVLNPAKPLQNFALMGFAENSGRFDNHDSFASLSGVQTSGSGAGLVVTSLTYDPEVPNTYTANAGAAPVDAGYTVLTDGSSVHWGTWRAGDYTYDDGGGPYVPTLPWQYIIASNYVDLLNVTGLMGSATYNYIGGSQLTDAAGLTVASLLGTSYITLDFANSGFEVSDLFLATDNLGIFSCVSICSLQDLQQGSINVQNDLATYGGNVGGSFVGNGSGLIMTLDLYDFSLGNAVRGTAAFGTDTAPEFGRAFFGGNQDGTFNNVSAANYSPSSITLAGSGSGQYVSAMSMTVEGDYFYAGLSGGPDTQGYHQLASGGEVIWGIWDAGNYTVDIGDGGGAQVASSAPWHYMYSADTVDAPQLSGLTGTFTYNYVGGTDLIGAAAYTQIDSGTINVNFGTQEMFVDMTISDGAALSVSLSNADASYNGFRSISSFYTTGIGIIDDPLNTFVSGVVGGTFVGQGEGIMTSVQVVDSATGTSYGEAVFETAGAVAVPAP